MADRNPRPSIAEAERRPVRAVAFVLEMALFFMVGAALMLAGPALSRLWEMWP